MKRTEQSLNITENKIYLLLLAIQKQNYQQIDELIEEGTMVDIIISGQTKTILKYAANYDLKVLDFLLNVLCVYLPETIITELNYLVHPGDINKIEKSTGETLRSIAQQKGYIYIEKLLNWSEQSFAELLSIAILDQNYQQIDKLIKEGIRVDTIMNVPDSIGQGYYIMTPLKYVFGNFHLLENLLYILCNYRGIRAALEEASHIITLEAIDTKEAQTGDTSLIFAIKNGYTYIAELLYHCGADINIKNNKAEIAADYYKDYYKWLVQFGNNIYKLNPEELAQTLQHLKDIKNQPSDYFSVLMASATGVTEETTTD